jgi:hypothetical protein
MCARRTPILAFLLLAGLPSLHAAPGVAADPHDLYETARTRLGAGDLREAAEALARLQSLITSHPDWDPDGAYANHLVPSLRARVHRLQVAESRLDEFADHALDAVKPPDIRNEMSTVKQYTHWATCVINHLRMERDAIVETSVPDAEEKALLIQTDSYARSERLLEQDVLAKMAEVAGDDILGLLAGNPELDSVLVRFRQLKQEVMKGVAENERLAQRLKESDARNERLLGVVADVVTDAAAAPAHGGKTPSVDERFARFLDAEREGLRQQRALTSTERDLLQASLERYRKSNRALVAAGVISDQSARLKAIAQAVDELPPAEAPAASSPSSGWLRTVFVALFASGGAFLAGRAARRRRRPAAETPPAPRRLAA